MKLISYLFLVLFLVGCATEPQVVFKVKKIPVNPTIEERVDKFQKCVDRLLDKMVTSENAIKICAWKPERN